MKFCVRCDTGRCALLRRADDVRPDRHHVIRDRPAPLWWRQRRFRRAICRPHGGRGSTRL